MNSRLALDSLGNVVCQLYAVKAKRAGRCCSIDWGTAVAAEDSGHLLEEGYSSVLGRTYVAPDAAWDGG